MSRDLACQRVDTLQRWLRRNDMALIDTTTGQPPGLIAYRLESLMDELADVGAQTYERTDSWIAGAPF
jgi:hypothetical protein